MIFLYKDASFISSGPIHLRLHREMCEETVSRYDTSAETAVYNPHTLLFISREIVINSDVVRNREIPRRFATRKLLNKYYHIKYKYHYTYLTYICY